MVKITKFITRSSPFTAAHREIVRRAADVSDIVNIDIGSSRQPRNERTPFTFQEREQMIRAAFPASLNERLLINPVLDSPYSNSEWQGNIQASTKSVLDQIGHSADEAQIKLIGHRKDRGTSFYLDMFPEYGSYGVENLFDNFSATYVRDAFFDAKGWSADHQHNRYLPDSTIDFLQDFTKTEDADTLFAEVAFAREYRKHVMDAETLLEERNGGRFRPEITLMTADAMIVCSGAILLIERMNFPGRGLLALPGGFVDQGERVKEAMLRELREEVRLKVPEPVIEGSIRGFMLADYEHRSMRGRLSSGVYAIKLKDQRVRPDVKPRSEARRAFWCPIADLRPENMFEDHYFIIKHLLPQLAN